MEALNKMNDEEIIELLSTLKGIGVWSQNSEREIMRNELTILWTCPLSGYGYGCNLKHGYMK